MSVQASYWMIWALVTVVGHWCLPASWRNLWLIAVTAVFLVVHSPISATILALFTLATYYLTRDERVAGWKVAALGAVILGLLALYKINLPESYQGVLLSIAIPLGLSYYALRCLHYMIERYKGTLPEHSFADYCAYQFFFPTIVAGPIHRFAGFDRELFRRRWDLDKFSRGMERILYGYAKIVVLGNFVISTVFAEYIASLPASEAVLIAYLEILRNALNLYFQFAGYSDVAIGLGLLLGFQVMENFNWPFIRKNISEFWRSWHISLSSWCRDYVYMVVISNLRSPALAAVASMLTLGLWHEISLRYVLWGVYHGLGIATWQAFQRVKPHLPEVHNPWARRALDGLSILLTFHFVIFGFSIVQDRELAQAGERFATLLWSWW